MTKKIQELKADTVLKNYWSNNEQFADLFNAVLFDGNQVIHPEELEEADTEASSLLEHGDYAMSIKASRDTIKIQKKSTVYGVQLVMLGLEHQEQIHYAMPMRVMGYDYGTYKKQYDTNARKYKTANGMEKEEYLSRMKKTDKLIPVITVVVYYGEKAYDGAVSLHGMLAISDEMMDYVNDYKILLIEARKNRLALHNMNNKDLFNLLEILLDKDRPLKETKERAIEYTRKNQIDKTVVLTVAGAVNCKINYHALAEKGEADMCTVFEEIAKESERKGKAIGKTIGEAKGIIETGYELGVSEQDILERLQKKLNMPLQTAQKYLKMFGKGAV